MDRKIIYPGQIPLETDLLGTNQSTMVALSKLASALFGTSNTAVGLAVAPTSPATLSVSVGAGEIYSLQPLEATAYSSLPADTTHSIVKQGILLDAVTLSCPAPTTAGFSINYLIEAAYQDVDDTSTVLPFYNASNPSQAYSGPNNTGASSTTRRAGAVALQAKAGIAATTGTQTTPAADAGFVALAVVTVANGQATIVAGNIVASGIALNTPATAGRYLNTQTFAASGTYTPTPGTKKVVVEVQGGGGGGGGVAATAASQFAIGGGGMSGAYGKSVLTTGFTGGIAITVGAGGAGGAAGQNNGAQGGSSSFGALIVAPGGFGGSGGPASANGGSVFAQTTGTQVVATGGNLLNSAGNGNAMGFGTASGALVAGSGNSSAFGGGGKGGVGGTSAGVNSASLGAGGGGASANASSASQAGGNGGGGVVIVTEYA